MAEALKVGDYVLATKFSDGDPKDPFAIGFIHSMQEGPRFRIVDQHGMAVYGGAMRRAKKITKERGHFLVSHIDHIENAPRSVWWWVRCRMRDNNR